MIDDRPRAIDGLDVHEVDDGLVIYDGERDRVHYLNATATVVFTFCDGNRTLDEIAALVRAAWDLDSAPLDAVITCIRQLRDEGVLA